MLVLICGDRKWGDYRCTKCKSCPWPCPPCHTKNHRLLDQIRLEILAHGLTPEKDVILNGGAKGADSAAKMWGEKLGFKVVTVDANWDKFGKAAGPIRNREMLKLEPDLVLAFHPNLEQSSGTKHMVEIARAAGVPVEVYTQ